VPLRSRTATSDPSLPFLLPPDIDGGRCDGGVEYDDGGRTSTSRRERRYVFLFFFFPPAFSPFNCSSSPSTFSSAGRAQALAPWAQIWVVWALAVAGLACRLHVWLAVHPSPGWSRWRSVSWSGSQCRTRWCLMSRSGSTVAVEAALSPPLEDRARYAGPGGARPAPCRGARRRGRCVLRACRGGTRLAPRRGARRVPVETALDDPVGHCAGRGGARPVPRCGARRPGGNGSIN